MKQLTHAQREEKEQAGRRLPRILPVVAGAIAFGFTLGAPLPTDAQQAGKCAVSVESGKISSFTQKSGTAWVVSTPLLEKNRYLKLTLPAPHVEEIRRAAQARGESERAPFISGIVQSDAALGLKALGNGKRATFTCAPVPAQPAAAPAPSPGKAPSKGPAPAAVPAGKAAPAAVPPARTQSAPRRTVDLSSPEPAAQKAEAVIPPAKRGGKGTESEPYVIEVPVPSKRDAGTQLAREGFSYSSASSDGGPSVKVHLALRFVASGKAGSATKTALANAITPLVSGIMRDELRAKGRSSDVSTGSIGGSVRSVIERAGKANPEVAAYAGGS